MNSEPTIVLDLDETLIHTFDESVERAKPFVELYFEMMNHFNNNTTYSKSMAADFTKLSSDRTIVHKPYVINYDTCAWFKEINAIDELPNSGNMRVVFIRPYMGMLLNYLLSKGCRLIIFTAGQREYGHCIARLICNAVWEGENKFSAIYTYSNLSVSQDDEKIKDISKIVPDLTNALLLDNKTMNAMMEPNAIVPVIPFNDESLLRIKNYGIRQMDYELRKVIIWFSTLNFEHSLVEQNIFNLVV